MGLRCRAVDVQGLHGCTIMVYHASLMTAAMLVLAYQSWDQICKTLCVTHASTSASVRCHRVLKTNIIYKHQCKMVVQQLAHAIAGVQALKWLSTRTSPSSWLHEVQNSMKPNNSSAPIATRKQLRSQPTADQSKICSPAQQSTQLISSAFAQACRQPLIHGC